MDRIKFLFGMVILFGFLQTGFADVVFDAEFRVKDLTITSKIEPSDSNRYHHISLIGCYLATVEIGKPLLPVKLISLVIPADEEVADKLVEKHT